MQCKDIPTEPIVRFINGVFQDNPPGYRWCNWYDDSSLSVRNAMPSGTPDNLVIAKMRQLVKRRLVDGCPCGCRGDFVPIGGYDI